jgi:alkylated DNA repair dioxygenase AlkB
METIETILDDTYIIYDINELKDISIDLLKKEIIFNEMYSQGSPVPRLISIQGIYTDLKPLYRHPMDSQPEIQHMTPIVKKICDIVSNKCNEQFNHVLIQMYRNGNDYIGEHADKTLDIKKNTKIVNYSIGSTRVMKLRTKKNDNSDREIKKVKLKHNSLFVLGWNANKKWLHSINPDKRPDIEKSEDELFNNCERISFTFRNIATFIDNNNHIIGQGSKFQQINTDIELLKLFSRENHEIDFDYY